LVLLNLQVSQSCFAGTMHQGTTTRLSSFIQSQNVVSNNCTEQLQWKWLLLRDTL